MRYLAILFCFTNQITLLAQLNMVNSGVHLIQDTGLIINLPGHFVANTGANSDLNGILNLTGNFNNTGLFDQDTGTVNLTGAGVQYLSGDSSVFYFLNSSNVASTVTSGDIRIRHTLTMQSGTFNTNDSLIILSDANRTARIAEIPIGAAINGDITVQRYLDAGVSGYHLLGAPVAGATFEQWHDDFTLYGFTGAHIPASTSSIYYYTESDTGSKNLYGYHGPNNVTDGFVNGLGYFTYVDAVPVTIEVKGPAHTFGQALPVSYTNNVNVTHDGWNLVSNPYPSNIYWNSTGWTKVNIDNALYVYDADNGVYTSYVSGVSTNGGSPYLASSQGFWVKANAPGPVLTLTEPVKTAQDVSFFRRSADLSNEPQLHLRIQSVAGGLSDETVLCLSSLSTNSWDSEFDAYKLEDNYSSAPYIATVLSDSIDLSVNALPEVVRNGTIPLRIKVGKTGNYKLRIDRQGVIAPNNCLYLEDLETKQITDLKTDSTYTFSISDSVEAPRFLIHTNPKIDLGADTTLPKGDSLLLDAGAGYAQYYWSTGDVSRKITVSDSGTYRVDVENDFGCSGFDEIQVKIDTTGTSVQAKTNVSKLMVFPNPARDYVRIRTNGTAGTFRIQLRMADGKLVLKKQVVLDQNSTEFTINCTGLAEGPYSLVIEGPEGLHVSTLIIRR